MLCNNFPNSIKRIKSECNALNMIERTIVASKPIRGGYLLIQSTLRGKPIEVIQNPLERENIRESMDTNKILFPVINMRKISVYIREQFFEAKIKQPRNQAIMEYLVQWKNLSVGDTTCEDESFI